MDHYNGTAQTNTDTARTNTGTQKLLYGELSGTILRIFYRVYDRLGFGFLESVYKNALAKEFTREGIPFEREVAIEVLYDGDCIGLFRADFLVDNKIVLEVKASNAVVEADRKQLLNYLRSSRIELGLLLHFGPKPFQQRMLYTNDQKRF